MSHSRTAPSSRSTTTTPCSSSKRMTTRSLVRPTKSKASKSCRAPNGLTGTGINLNGATGVNGGSNATSNLTAWGATDNDVLKITDIGFVQTSSGTIDANLDFAFALVDADGDHTLTQHILASVSNNFIV